MKNNKWDRGTKNQSLVKELTYNEKPQNQQQSESVDLPAQTAGGYSSTPANRRGKMMRTSEQFHDQFTADLYRSTRGSNPTSSNNQVNQVQGASMIPPRVDLQEIQIENDRLKTTIMIITQKLKLKDDDHRILIDKMKQQMIDLQDKNNYLEMANRETTQQLDEINNQTKDDQTNRTELNSKIRDLGNQNEIMETQIAQMQDKFKKMMKEMQGKLQSQKAKLQSEMDQLESEYQEKVDALEDSNLILQSKIKVYENQLNSKNQDKERSSEDK